MDKIVLYSFCGVFTLKNKLFIVREQYAGGANKMLMPPKELKMNITPIALGEEIEMALNDYLPQGRSIYADEWETLNKALLEYFDEESVNTFESNKQEVNIRRESMSTEVVLFSPEDEELTLLAPSIEYLGEAVIKMLFPKAENF